MKLKFVLAIIPVCVAVLLSSCDSNRPEDNSLGETRAQESVRSQAGFDRELALKIIANHSQFRTPPTSIPFKGGANARSGIYREGHYAAIESGLIVDFNSNEISDEGRKYFTKVGSQLSGPSYAYLLAPVRMRPTIVTGIRGVNGNTDLRLVEFEWEFVGIPQPIKGFMRTGGGGVALLQLYDDGWRIIKIEKESYE